MNTSYQQQKNYPDHDRQLFEGAFSAKIRELVFGSSRWDVLATIRQASLDNWTISASGQEIRLSSSNVALKLDLNQKGISWITATTPRGDFSIPKDNWIAVQIARLINQCLESYELGLKKHAELSLAQLYQDVQRNVAHDWTVEKMTEFTLPDYARLHHEYSCNLASGLIATVERSKLWNRNVSSSSYSGVHSNYTPVGGYERPPVDHTGWRMPPSEYSTSYTYSDFTPSPRSLHHDEISVSVRHYKLSQLSTALNAGCRILARSRSETDVASMDRAVFRQAQKLTGTPHMNQPT